MQVKKIFNLTVALAVVISLFSAALWMNRWLEETRVLKKVIERLSADTRIAEVLVTKSEYNELSGKVETTIKFLEYDTSGKALPPKYFTFHGNIIQFQSLVVRFDDSFVRAGDALRGKSVYMFMKAFVLDGEKTQTFEITKTEAIPSGYRVAGDPSEAERKWWEDFWEYALDPAKREAAGIKNVQIEAPGSIFVPGTIYTLHIEHDGGLRIDARPLPEILKGEEL